MYFNSTVDLIEGTANTEYMQIQRELVKNPNWWEADPSVIYKRGRGNKTRDYQVTNPASGRAGIEPAISESKSCVLTITVK